MVFPAYQSPIDQILDIRHVPVPAARSPNTACIECGGDATQIYDSGFSDSFNDRKRVRGKQGGILGLSFSPDCCGVRSIALIAKLSAFGLASGKCRSRPLGN